MKRTPMEKRLDSMAQLSAIQHFYGLRDDVAAAKSIRRRKHKLRATAVGVMRPNLWKG